MSQDIKEPAYSTREIAKRGVSNPKNQPIGDQLKHSGIGGKTSTRWLRANPPRPPSKKAYAGFTDTHGASSIPDYSASAVEVHLRRTPKAVENAPVKLKGRDVGGSTREIAKARLPQDHQRARQLTKDQYKRKYGTVEEARGTFG